MRTAKVQAQSSAAALAGSEHKEESTMRRLRKTARSASGSLSSVSSAHSSDAEGPTSPRHLSLAQARTSQQPHAVVIDHQGAGKVVHKPDGTVVWEPAPESAGAAAGNGGGGSRGPRQLVESVLLGLVGVPAYFGLLSAMMSATDRAPVTGKELAAHVAHQVAGCVAGTAAGVVLGPLLAVRMVVGVAVRPAVLALIAHAGVSAWRRWGGGVACLLRKLHSPDAARVLEALRAIIAAASRGSPRFAREFNRLKGVEALLAKLADALPDCPLLHLIAQALAELCKDQECRESLVAAGGVPRLVSLLQSPNPAVSSHGLAALGLLADNALAVEAIREAGGLTRLVELTAAAVTPAAPAGGLTSVGSGSEAAVGGGRGGAAGSGAAAAAANRRTTLMHAVKLLRALSLDPASKAAIGAAGGVSALLDVIARSESRSEAQSAAIAALHNALRGSPDNQRALAALPAASEVLRAALAGYGPCWQPAKGDLHALLNVLARLQGVQEAGGFVVVQSQAAAAAATPTTTTAAARDSAAAAPGRA